MGSYGAGCSESELDALETLLASDIFGDGLRALVGACLAKKSGVVYWDSRKTSAHQLEDESNLVSYPVYDGVG